MGNMNSRKMPPGLREVGSLQWEYRYRDKDDRPCLMQIGVTGDKLGMWDGPEDSRARDHEAGGGTFEFEHALGGVLLPEHPELARYLRAILNRA